MHKWIIGLLVIAALLAPTAAQAQAAPKINAVKIDLWPEYDRPTMLVIYHLTLSPATTLPVQLTLRIPAAAGGPNAVAVRQADGQLFSLPYEQKVSGEWTQLSFSATSLEIQIEYYDPGLTKAGSARHYVYQWPGDYATDALVLEIQRPIDVTTLEFSPNAVKSGTSTDGLTYYTVDAGALKAAQTYALTINYQKNTDTLTAQSLQVQPSAPIPSTNAGGFNWQAALPWLMGGLGALLIVGGGFWYWQSGRQNRRTEPRKRTRGPRVDNPSTSDEAIYCHQCGNRAGAGDQYCRSCGIRLRIE